MLSASSYQAIVPPEPKTFGRCPVCKDFLSAGEAMARDMSGEIYHEECYPYDPDDCEFGTLDKYGDWERGGREKWRQKCWSRHET